MSNKITKGGTAEAPTYVESEQTTTDNVVDMVTSPLNAFTDSNEFVNKQDAAQQVLMGAAVGFVAGDIFGARVPILGGRR